MRLIVERWNIRLDLYDDQHSIGLGWWQGSAKVFRWHRSYYDGWWFEFRLGPFFYSRNPL